MINDDDETGSVERSPSNVLYCFLRGTKRCTGRGRRPSYEENLVFGVVQCGTECGRSPKDNSLF